MKKIVILLFALGFSVSALAVPRNLYLVSPKQIFVKGTQVTLTLELPCKNESPEEWAGNLVSVSDDEGDSETALAVVLSKDSCKSGPIKEFKLNYNIKETGVSIRDLKNGVTFVPAILEK